MLYCSDNGSELKMKTKEDLALEFSITQQQIMCSNGKLQQDLIKERERILRKYKKLLRGK